MTELSKSIKQAVAKIPPAGRDNRLSNQQKLYNLSDMQAQGRYLANPSAPAYYGQRK